MDGILELIWFLIRLPVHIYHTVTLGKYAKKESESSVYNAAGILIIVFSILGLFIYLLLQLKK